MDCGDQGRTDEIAETLERLDVADTLEDLRLNIDALIERLAHERADERPAAAESVPTRRGVLDEHIEDLGQKVEGATDLLAELADLLESQSERIETIEQQLGDPDLFTVSARAEREPRPAVPRVEPALPHEPERPDAGGVDAFAIAEVLRDLKSWLDDRFAGVENAVSRLDDAVAEVRDLGAAGDRRVRDLEDRLLILVDSGLDNSPSDSRMMNVPMTESSAACRHVELGGSESFESVQPAFASAASRARAPEVPPLTFRHRPVTASPVRPAEPVATPYPLSSFSDFRSPDPSRSEPEFSAVERMSGAAPPVSGLSPSASDWDSPMDARAARRLEELVEREVRLQQSFAAGAEIPPAADSVRTSRKRPTVMVVDDSADARTILSIYLSKTGYQVVTAASAEDCLAKLRHHAVDAVILDASMPGGGGAHVCRVLRDDPQYRGTRLPVIVYTAHPDVFSREEAVALGASDYVVKSGDLLPLITCLVRHTQNEGPQAHDH